MSHHVEQMESGALEQFGRGTVVLASAEKRNIAAAILHAQDLTHVSWK